MRLDSIKVRITSFVGVTLFIVMAALIAISGVTLWNTSSKDTLVNAEALAAAYSSKTQDQMNQAIIIARTVAVSLGGMRESMYLNRESVDTMLQNILGANPVALASFTLWERDTFDGRDSVYANDEGHNSTGQYLPYWSRGAGGAYVVEPLVDYDTSDYYQLPKRTGLEAVTDPYFYSVQGKDEFIASLVSPIFVKEKFVGIAGIDIKLGFLEEAAEQQHLFDDTGEVVVIANHGAIVAHSGQPKSIGRKINNIYPELPELGRLVQNGEERVLFNKKLLRYQILKPIHVGKSPTPWSVMVTLPESYIADKAKEEVTTLVLTAIGLIIFGLICMWFVASRVANPMILMSKAANNVANSSFQDLSTIPDESNFSGELLDMHSALKSMCTQAVDALAEADAQSREAKDKARIAEQAVRESEQAKLEGEQATQRGIAEAASRIQHIVERVSSASEQLFALVNQSSQGAEVQRDRMTETATAMEEMNATVLEVAKNASEAAGNADAAKGRAAEGATIVNNVVDSITEINRQVVDMKSGLDELGIQAEGIGQVMDVISDIADQTNLLALNAAIEAARAGDAGRGFAVVADEVRKLAEKTMTATHEVGKSIASIQAGTRHNIKSMEEVAVVVGSSTEQAQQSGTSLTNIVTIAESTADQVRAIATASEEQAATSEQINRGTEEVNRISGETNESMGQASSALVELSSLTDELASIVREMQK